MIFASSTAAGRYLVHKLAHLKGAFAYIDKATKLACQINRARKQLDSTHQNSRGEVQDAKHDIAVQKLRRRCRDCGRKDMVICTLLIPYA